MTNLFKIWIYKMLQSPASLQRPYGELTKPIQQKILRPTYINV
jgi:hypothetical protein